MPQNDNAADSQGVTTGEQEVTTATEQPATQEGRHGGRPSTVSPKSVLEKLGVPVELHGEIGKGVSPNAVADDDDDGGKEEEAPPIESNTEEEQPEARDQKSEVSKGKDQTDVVSQKDTKEAEEESEHEHEHEQEHEESDDKPPKDAKPGWERKRIGQMARQKRELNERIAELETQLAEKAEGKEPVFVDRGSDPLAHVDSPEKLQKIREDARQLRKWCNLNRNGAMRNAGTDKEEPITPEQVAQWLSEAEDLLDEHIPKKATQLQQRGVDDELARKKYPPLFDKRSQEYQIGKMLDRELPGLATHPSRNLVIGDYLRGAKMRLEEEARVKEQGSHAASSKLPEALTRNQNGHIPPIAPETARVPSNSPAVPQARKLVADATKNVIAEGGSLESIKQLILAKRQANRSSANPRSAVAV